jgi:hypothetical protein
MSSSKVLNIPSSKEILNKNTLEKTSVQDLQKSLTNINIGLNKANKTGVFDMQESHQLYNDIQHINKILVLLNKKTSNNDNKS